MIVRLHLEQDVDLFLVRGIDVGRGIREEAATAPTANHRRIVAIGGEHTLAAQLVGIANHLEERARLAHTIHTPSRVEDLVPAVLAVSLREHVQLHIRRITSKALKLSDKIINLIRRQREPQLTVRSGDGIRAKAQHIDPLHRLCDSGREQFIQLLLALEEDALRHAVMQQCGQRLQ